MVARARDNSSASSSWPAVDWIDLGLIEYDAALALQRQKVLERQHNQISDCVLLAEHPAVVTVGRKPGSQQNILASTFPIVEVERGGDVTFHAPGQLVGYPILSLVDEERDLHGYLRKLETMLIEVCRAVGVQAESVPGATGVWTQGRKLASIGIAVRKWVTFHGFALNVSCDLTGFSALRPCGFDAAVMTSLERERGQKIDIAQVKQQVRAQFGERFGRRVIAA